MSRGRGTAYARAALLGNPSDGYGGRTISFVFTNLSGEGDGLEPVRSALEGQGCKVVPQVPHQAGYGERKTLEVIRGAGHRSRPMSS